MRVQVGVQRKVILLIWNSSFGSGLDKHMLISCARGRSTWFGAGIDWDMTSDCLKYRQVFPCLGSGNDIIIMI